MNYLVITENDESQWFDKTGELYHFPKRYLKYLVAGTKVIYYKGRIKNKSFENKRLSKEPHYFGIAEIGKAYPDKESKKGDYFVEILKFKRLSIPILAKINNQYLESIPESKINNYWRDAVRQINKATYDKILNQSDLEPANEVNDQLQGQDEAFTSGIEGNKKQSYTTTYERDRKLRNEAIKIHGLTCMACGVNFKEMYGEWGKGFIHVHHTKPVSEGLRKVNPKTDMIVLCPNCHSMVHRRKKKTLTLGELKKKIRQKS